MMKINDLVARTRLCGYVAMYAGGGGGVDTDALSLKNDNKVWRLHADKT